MEQARKEIIHTTPVKALAARLAGSLRMLARRRKACPVSTGMETDDLEWQCVEDQKEIKAPGGLAGECELRTWERTNGGIVQVERSAE
jgi:hypothetical protein